MSILALIIGVFLVGAVAIFCRGKRVDIFLSLTFMRPEDPSGWFTSGTLLMDKEKYKQALICFEEVFKIDPHYMHLEERMITCTDKLYKDFEGWE
jgi:hypothetical protein